MALVLVLPSFIDGVRMVTSTFQLQSLGWKVIGDEQQADGRWCAIATSCGHTIIAIADRRDEAWLAVRSLALKLTRNGLRP